MVRPAKLSRAVKIAVGALYQPGDWRAPIAAVERVKSRQAAARTDLEHGTRIVSAAARSCAVEIVIATPCTSPGHRIGPISAPGEREQIRKAAARTNPKHSTRVVYAAARSCAVEIAIGPLHQPGHWIGPITAVE